MGGTSKIFYVLRAAIGHYSSLYAALIIETVGTIADRAKDMMKLKYKTITVTILYLLQFRLRCFLGGEGEGGGKAHSFLLELGRHIYCI